MLGKMVCSALRPSAHTGVRGRSAGRHTAGALPATVTIRLITVRYAEARSASAYVYYSL